MKTVLICLVVLAICGCVRERTVRTDLSKWETYKWTDMGIQMDRPVMAEGFSIHHHSSFPDGRDNIEVTVEKYTPEAFAESGKISPENPLSQDRDYMDWLKWLRTFHDEISERPINERQKEYRRDIRTKDSIVCIHVQYTFVEFTPEEQSVDEAAIRRILLSARPIEEIPQPTNALYSSPAVGSKR